MILLTKTKQLTRKRVLIPSNIYWFSIKLNFTPPPKKIIPLGKILVEHRWMNYFSKYKTWELILSYKLNFRKRNEITILLEFSKVSRHNVNCQIQKIFLQFPFSLTALQNVTPWFQFSFVHFFLPCIPLSLPQYSTPLVYLLHLCFCWCPWGIPLLSLTHWWYFSKNQSSVCFLLLILSFMEI